MATAVICEFNPFHNGHKYLIEQSKKITGEPVIAIMSGSFTQRGEAAVTDKFSRAKTALQNGVDLVLELPAVYSVANAQRFAACGVHIAKSFCCVNYLAFGCETQNTDLLLKAAQATENPEVQSAVAEKMKSGNYYPRALESAVRQVMGGEIADILKTPNNILAVEYLKNLKNSEIAPLSIKRIGTAHDSKETYGSFASASHIRGLMRQGQPVENFVPYVPKNITLNENLERALLYRLRSMTAEDFKKLPDVSEGLENRILSAVGKYNSVKEITDAVKTKRYTHARIRRILCCALLGIDEGLQNVPAEYARVLGFNSVGASLLKDCRINVVTSTSDGLKLGGNTEILLKKDIFAANIASLAYSDVKSCNTDFVTPIIKFKSEQSPM